MTHDGRKKGCAEAPARLLARAAGNAGHFEIKRFGTLDELFAHLFAQAGTNGSKGPHAVVSDDVHPLALECIRRHAAIDMCDFASTAAIDAAVRRDTVVVYGELPSYGRFRVNDFAAICRFARSVGILTAVGTFFLRPESLRAPEAFDPDAVIEIGAADEGEGLNEGHGDDARKIFEALRKSPYAEGANIVYPHAAEHRDYKSIRRLLGDGGDFIRVSGLPANNARLLLEKFEKSGCASVMDFERLADERKKAERTVAFTDEPGTKDGDFTIMARRRGRDELIGMLRTS